MRLFWLYSIFVFASLTYGQTLVGNENGQWIIYANGERIPLQKTVHKVGNYDQAGFTFFAEQEKYGILDDQGNRVYPAAFREVSSMGNGVYQCLTEHGQLIIDFATFDQEPLKCEGASRIARNWYIIDHQNHQQLFNTISKEYIKLGIGDTLLNAGFNHVYASIEGQAILYDGDGKAIDLNRSRPLFDEHHLLINSPEMKSIVYRDRKIDLSTSAHNIHVFDTEIFYSSGGRSYVISSGSGKEIFSADYDKISRFANGLFLIEKDNLKGLLTKKGDLICSPKYTYIYDCGAHYSVANGGGNGIMDKQGKELVPCAYQWVRASNDFFETKSELGFSGLISRRTNSILLDCIYDRISITGNKIRAWSGGKLRIIELDAQHKVLTNVVLSNVITLKTRQHQKADRTIDERLFSIGWVMEWVTKYDKDGYATGKVRKWGLRGANDSLILPIKYNQPVFVPHANFSLLPFGEMEYAYAGQHPSKVKAYRLMGVDQGRMLSADPIFDVDTSDLLSRSYIRVLGAKGPGILRENNKLEYVDFIEGSNADYIRFCKAKQRTIVPAKKTDKDAVAIPDMDLNNSPSLTTFFLHRNKKYTYVRFKEGLWNYFDTEGNPVFEESFSFAKPFYRQTAIVQRANGWGVARNDSLVIPCKYSSIDRIEFFGDTVFKVQRYPKGIRVLDTLSQLVSGGITKVIKSGTGVSLIQSGREKKVINSEYQIISDDSPMKKLIGGNLFMSKRKKQFIISDHTGTELAAIELRPAGVIHDDLVVVKDGGKYGLINFFGDTLVPFEYKEIKNLGDYIVCLNGVQNSIFSSKVELIKNVKTGRFLIDEETGDIAVNYIGKCEVLSADGKVIKRFSKFEADFFHNGFLIKKGKNSEIKTLTGETINFCFLIKEVEVFKGHGFLFKDYKNESHFYSSRLKQIGRDLHLRQARYVGNGFIQARVSGIPIILSEEKQLILAKGAKIHGDFCSGYLLLSEGLRYYYINANMENAFHRYYSDACPFKDDFASVKEKNGWTIIDKKGYPKSLGAYDKIDPVGNNLFVTKKQPLYGLFDAHGNEIIPVEFQEINVLNKNLIQCVKEGDIHYFDCSGKPILFQ